MTVILARTMLRSPEDLVMNEAEPRAARSQGLRASKVPEVILLFWIMKIAATTLGETAGDLLSMTLNVGYAVSSLILSAAEAFTLL